MTGCETCTWLLGVIWFDTAHVGWLFRPEDFCKIHQAVFELSGSLNDQQTKIKWCEILRVYFLGFFKIMPTNDQHRECDWFVTISGRFWSMTSSLRKQWLRIWLSDWHMTWTETKPQNHKSTLDAPPLFLFTQAMAGDRVVFKGCGEALPCPFSLSSPLSGSCSASHCSCRGNLNGSKNTVIEE